LVGVAVNITEAPTQLGFDPEVTAIAIVGTNDVLLIAIVIAVEVAVGEVAHNAFEVNTQVTTCPAVSVFEVNVVLFVPTLLPSTCH
jgi:hypothetical protein